MLWLFSALGSFAPEVSHCDQEPCSMSASSEWLSATILMHVINHKWKFLFWNQQKQLGTGILSLFLRVRCLQVFGSFKPQSFRSCQERKIIPCIFNCDGQVKFWIKDQSYNTCVEGNDTVLHLSATVLEKNITPHSLMVSFQGTWNLATLTSLGKT